MTTTFQKDPTAILDFGFDWTQWLATGETITTFTVTVPTGLTLASSSQTAGVVTAWLSGGAVAGSYRVECLIATSAGRTDERSIRVLVAER